MQRVIRAGLLIDGTEGGIISKPLIFLEGDTITKISCEEEKVKGEVIDLSNCTILPGLIDCHVHLFMEGIFDMGERGKRWKETKDLTIVRAVKNLQQTLKMGVTTIRDLGGAEKIPLLMKKSANQGILTGPRVLAAGQAISITGGHFHYGGNRQADGPEEMVKAVREQIKAGADLIKIMLTGCVNFLRQNAGFVELTKEEIQAVVGEAHRLGKKVAVHVNGVAGIKLALEAGVDTIEHGTLLDEQTTELIARSGVYWVPTLMPFQRMWDYGNEYGYAAFPPEGVEKIYGQHREMLRKAVNLGAKITVGTDAGALGVEHGDVAGEISLLVKHKILTPLAALQSGTIRAAEALGWEKKIGTIEPGKKADIIGVRGNPLQDINVLRQVTAVFKDGTLMHSSN